MSESISLNSSAKMVKKVRTAQWVIYYTAGGDRAIFAKNHHPNFAKSFLGVKLHYI